MARDLSELRKEIDRIDDEIVRLIQERMAVCGEVAEYKKEQKVSILDPEREVEKLADIEKKSLPEMATYTKMLYNKILEASRDYQYKLIGEEERNE